MTLNLESPIVTGDGQIELAFTVDTDVNLTAASVYMSLRRKSESGPVALTKTGTITDDDAKEFSVFLSKAETEDLSGVYYFDAVIVDASNNQITVRNADGSAGRVEFTKRVTVLP
jgi:uncharacterized protein (UPF0333 family)